MYSCSSCVEVFNSYYGFSRHCQDGLCGTSLLSSRVPVAQGILQSVTQPLPDAVQAISIPDIAGSVMDSMMTAADRTQDNEQPGDAQAPEASTSDASHSSHTDPEPSPDPHIRVGDRTDMPDVIKAHMFSNQSVGLSSSSLYSSVGVRDGIGYNDRMFQKLQPTEKSSIHLLNLLRGQDLKLYDQVQNWRYCCSVKYDDPIENRTRPDTRQAQLGALLKTYGYQNLKPRKCPITLPNTKVKVDLIVFPFGEMMKSLLTDPALMQTDNLNIDKDNPYKAPKVGGDSGFFDDFQSGSVHCEAHRRYCNGPTDILNEILLFIDKSHLDVKGKHTLEPVMFTMDIFKRELRNLPQAWRPLGYLPNLDQLCPHASADEKLQDYHFCLRIILSELAAYQKLGGIDWKINLDGINNTECRFQIPVNCFMGDTEGHDKACCKKVCRSGKAKGSVCRYCNCTFSFLGYPYFGSNDPATGVVEQQMTLTKCAPIRRWRNQLSEANQGKLDNLGYKAVHDGFVDIHFSDPERALHGATPAEVLHAFQLGLAERAIETCFDTRRILKRKRKSENQSSSKRARGSGKAVVDKVRELEEEQVSVSGVNDGLSVEQSAVMSDGDEWVDTYPVEDFLVDSEQYDVVMDAVQEEETSRLHVFSKLAKERVDTLAKNLHRHLAWQSDPDLPRTSFPGGITKLTKMSGSERTGVLLLLLIILVMEHWAYCRLPVNNSNKKTEVKGSDNGYLEHAIGPERAANMVKALALMVQYEAFMRWTTIPRTAIRPVKAFIPDFLDQVFRSFNRLDGAGNNLVKNHFPLHLCDDITRLGSPQNYNSGPGETLHKVSVKQPGKRTNMNSKTFEFQCANRYIENLTIGRCYLDHPNWVLVDKESVLDKSDNDGISYHGRILSVHEKYVVDSAHRKHKELPLWGDSHVRPDTVVNLIREKLLPNLPTQKEVKVFTKTKRHGISFYAHPSYGKEQACKQDWCLLNTGGKQIPTHLLCILELEEDLNISINHHGTRIKKKGHYALVHQCPFPLQIGGNPVGNGPEYGTRAHIDQDMIHRMAIWREGPMKASPANPASTLLFCCDAISDTCIGFPDILCDNPRNEFFFIAGVSEWPNLFVDAAKRNKM
jgi:hypothetical protein